MKRESNQQSLKEILEKIIDQNRLREPLTEVRLNQAWAELMGHTIAKHTTQLILRKGVLVIRVDSSVLREELSYARDKIIQTLNQHFQRQAVREVRIV